MKRIVDLYENLWQAQSGITDRKNIRHKVLDWKVGQREKWKKTAIVWLENAIVWSR